MTLKQLLPDNNPRAVKYRELFCLNDILDRTPDVLSGGELQRFVCAVACSKDSILYLFDEPSSYLDIKQRLNMSDNIKSLQTDDNYIVVVEHDLSIMDYMCDYANIFYGSEGIYGVVSEPFNIRDAINIYLDGYLPTRNIQFRRYSLKYNVTIDDNMIKKKTYSYESYNYKVSNFNLNIKGSSFNSSECIVLLGQNGMGKTTFIRLLASLIPNEEVILNYSNITISYKPQKINPKFNGTTKQLLQSKINNSLNDSQFISDIINPLNIKDLYDIDVQDLSGGQIQKVAITLALGKPADIYLLDEPSSYLDSEQRIIVAKIIKKFIFNNKKCAFIVEHDFMMASYLADKVIVFRGNPSLNSTCSECMSLEDGMNIFLKDMNVTLRRDSASGRPRINKLDSVLDREQKQSGNLFQ